MPCSIEMVWFLFQYNDPFFFGHRTTIIKIRVPSARDHILAMTASLCWISPPGLCIIRVLYFVRMTHNLKHCIIVLYIDRIKNYLHPTYRRIRCDVAVHNKKARKQQDWRQHFFLYSFNLLKSNKHSVLHSIHRVPSSLDYDFFHCTYRHYITMTS